MAEKKASGDKGSKKKKKMSLLMISGIGGGIILLIIIILTWNLATNSGNDGNNEIPVLPGQNPAFGEIFTLDSFVVNLNDPGGKRYLKIKIELEFFQTGFQEELMLRLPQIRDAILLILSSKSFEDIQGIDGKIALRNELIVRINKLLKSQKIKNLYFTEFVVQ